MSSNKDIEASELESLAKNYSACDISDVLLKLKVPGAGFLPDILPLSTSTSTSTPRTASITSTITFIPLHTSPNTPSNLPQTHWTETPAPYTVCLISQPPNQSCAVVGDILATRLAHRNIHGIVVDGRVRDVVALKGLAVNGFGVWSKGTSTVGSGLEAKAWTSGGPVRVGAVVVVRPGDVMVMDIEERGVVVIPRDKFHEVLEMLPRVKAADDAVVEDVRNGVTVHEAFKKHRG